MYRSARHFVCLVIAALTFSAFSAQAAVQTNVSVPVSITVDIPCAGETVELNGNLHILFLLTADAAGGLLLKAHFQPQGISGFGLTTGVKYQATGETQEETHLKVLPFEDTFVNNFKIIGQGPGNNLLIHENFHITVNGRGIVTVLHDNASVNCKCNAGSGTHCRVVEGSCLQRA